MFSVNLNETPKEYKQKSNIPIKYCFSQNIYFLITLLVAVPSFEFTLNR